MVTCSPRNATLVWPQHIAAKSQLHHANEGADSVVKGGGKRARKRKGEGKRERERGGLSWRRGFCQLMIVLSTYTCLLHMHSKSAQCVSGICLACLHMLVCQHRLGWKGLEREEERIVFLFVFFKVGCIFPSLHRVPEQHKRERETPRQSVSVDQCRHKMSAAVVSICRQASCQRPPPPVQLSRPDWTLSLWVDNWLGDSLFDM